MKTKLIIFLMLTVGLATQTIAQDKSPYWVIETGPSMKGKTIVRIYDYQQNLIHEEVYHKVLSAFKRRDKKMLNKRLKAILAHEVIDPGWAKKMFGIEI